MFDGEDPCGSAATASSTDCVATGVPAALYGTAAIDSPAGQYNQFPGGNPDLDPEESDTWTVGAVFTPSFIPGLVMSVDWFDIYIDRTIGAFGASNTLDACYNLGNADARSRIHRTTGGLLWVSGEFVENLNINTGYQGTSGYGINDSYTTSLERFGFANMGDLSFNFVGTLLDDFSYNPGAGDDIQCVGLMDNSCGTPNPEWRHRLRASWRTPWDIETSLTWRHYGEVSMEGVTTARIDRDFPSNTGSTWPVPGGCGTTSPSRAASTTSSTRTRR